jgi:hypothetical protein
MSSKRTIDEVLTLTAADGSLDLCRFAEIIGAIRLSPAGETVEFRIGGDPGNLVMHPIAAQHTEMPVMISSAGTFFLIRHSSTTFQICISTIDILPRMKLLGFEKQLVKDIITSR